jgi:hypothetical protein
VSSRPIAGSPVLASGGYQCSGSTLHLTDDYPLGNVNADFSKQ